MIKNAGSRTIPSQYLDDYALLASYKNLEQAFLNARRGKTQKSYVLDFEKSLKSNLLRLQQELLFHAYRPAPLTLFVLRDPKTRKICKSEFMDRIVHHAVCNIIEPEFEKRFIHDSYANRIGKGTHNAIKRFDNFKRKVSKNNTRTCYVLKADIKHYFDTVSHKKLIELLQRRVFNEKILWLIKVILKNHNTSNPGKGMPLGNLTSQFFANVYLNELDQYVKHTLKAKHYIRYVDDFVILYHSKEVLQEYFENIETFLKEELFLELHPEKSQILKLEKGINFLGLRVFYHHKLLQRKNKRKFTGKLELMRRDYAHGNIEREQVVESFEGWLTYARQANTYKYRKSITRKFNKYFSLSQHKEPVINSVKKHENFDKKIEHSNLLFTVQQTLQLYKKGLSIQQIAAQRSIKEGTVWKHIIELIECHQLLLKEVISNNKIKKILKNCKSSNSSLKELKAKISDPTISYNDIACVIANKKGKNTERSIVYFSQWYQKTNCYRKCYANREQREKCRNKFQKLIINNSTIRFTKEEFLEFMNEKTKICELPEEEKRRFMSWKEFIKKRSNNVKLII